MSVRNYYLLPRLNKYNGWGYAGYKGVEDYCFDILGVGVVARYLIGSKCEG